MTLIQTNAKKQALPHDVGRSIVATCRDGKWRSVAEIARRAGTSASNVHAVLTTMCWRSSYGAKAEWKKVGKDVK